MQSSLESENNQERKNLLVSTGYSDEDMEMLLQRERDNTAHENEEEQSDSQPHIVFIDRHSSKYVNHISNRITYRVYTNSYYDNTSINEKVKKTIGWMRRFIIDYPKKLFLGTASYFRNGRERRNERAVFILQSDHFDDSSQNLLIKDGLCTSIDAISSAENSAQHTTNENSLPNISHSDSVLDSIFRRKIMNHLDWFDQYKITKKECTKDSSTVVEFDFCTENRNTYKDSTGKNALKRAHAPFSGSLWMDKKDFIQSIEQIVYPNALTEKDLVDMVILLSTGLSVNCITSGALYTKFELIKKLREIMTIAYVTIEHSRFLLEKEQNSKMWESARYIYKKFNILKEQLNNLKNSTSISDSKNSTALADLEYLAEMNDGIYDFLVSIANLSPADIEKVHKTLRTMQTHILLDMEACDSTPDKSDNSKVFLHIPELYSIGFEPHSLNQHLKKIEEILKNSTRAKVKKLYDIMEDLLNYSATDKSKEDRYKLAKEQICTGLFYTRKKVSEMIEQIEKLFFFLNMFIFFPHFGNPSNKISVYSYISNSKRYSIFCSSTGPSENNPAMTKFRNKKPDSYTTQMLGYMCVGNKKFIRERIPRLYKLRVWNAFGLHMGMSLTFLIHLFYFIASYCFNDINSARPLMVEYYLHIIFNMAFSTVISVYAFNELKKSRKHLKEHSAVYRLMSSIFSRYKYVVQYSGLLFASMASVCGHIVFLYFLFRPFLQSLSHSFSLFSSFSSTKDPFAMGFLFLSRTLLSFLFISTLVLFYFTILKKKMLYDRNILSKKTGFVFFSALLLYISILAYSTIRNTPHDHSEYYILVYNYHVGTVFYIAGFMALMCYHASTSLEKSEKLKNITNAKAVRCYTFLYIFFIALVMCLSGAVSVLYLYSRVISEYFILNKLSVNRVYELGYILPDL
ncbi:hypothetical protein NEMIN01_1917 [Nematocida minor]|uniref:uncharacterized protein n=1 Tax=Nematocida minor TaxID=1912983 RepID=UPI002220F535|nr:uncharacterized protein NEMIN01_1917 [Nematocida minor]KAI5192265.1 hypothetical protein NEMIN01_1917 [Nematocida minor]